jgi:N-carbamoylputrescine amidase
MDNIKMAVVCSKSHCGEPEENLENIIQWVQKAKEEKADFVLFPELSITGYWENPIAFWSAEKIDGESVTKLIAAAKENEIYLSAGLLEKDEAGVCYNTQIIVGPEGFVGKYRKTHMPVTEYFVTAKGYQLPVFPVNIGDEPANFGINICYDNCFPEPSRILALKGMNVLLSPFAFGMNKWDSEDDLENQIKAQDAWKKAVMRYLPARAHDNNVYVVACVCSGHVKGEEGKHDYYFPGVCMVFGPNGDLIAETPSEGVQERLLMCDLTFFKMEDSKKNAYFPLKYRRPELYKDIHKFPE